MLDCIRYFEEKQLKSRKCGAYLNCVYQNNRDNGAELLEITASLSIAYFAFYEMLYLRKIFLSTMEHTRADCREAIRLIQGISTDISLVDCDYNTDEIIAYVFEGMEIIIPD